MCPIQKDLRPQFSAFPNKAPFQLDSRKADSRSSSQERPFLGPQLIKPRCVWAPRLCQAWNLSLHSLAAVKSSVLPAKALESWGPERRREASDYCLQKGRGCPIWHSPCTVSLWTTTGIIMVRVTSQNTVWLQMPSLLSPLPPHLLPLFPHPPPHPLLSQICFSADFPPKAFPGLSCPICFPPPPSIL